MEHFANIPITILVKAPNQKIGDQTVECFMDWTVRRLKSHLSAVYPSQPTEKSQRIIYSGKLLQDHSILRDVLRKIDSDSFHTVHLVCNPTPDDQAESDRGRPARQDQSSPTPSESSTPSNQSTSSSRRTSVGETTTDGVRQRHPRRSESVGSSPGAYSTPYMQQFSVPGSPSAYQNMSPQQLQWMQHMYMQQMAAYYMQYHSGSSSPGVSPPWTPPAAYQFPQPMGQPQVANIPADQPAQLPGNNNVLQAAAAEAPRDAPRVQNQQMNAGVGPAINDDEEDGANRDWLDWIYTLCRFAVLLSIVYFYSSMNRFLLVAGIMFVVYLYENNFFRLRRRVVARVQEEPEVPHRPPEEAEPRGEDTPDGDRPGDTPGDDQLPGTDDDNSPDGSNPANSDGAPPPVEEPKPGFIGLIWIFVSTFFTSLIPQGPQHMNAN